MAQINKSLLKHEILQYENLKKITKDKTVPSFGKYMNNKYHFTDDELSNELDFQKAYTIIRSRHVKE